MDDNETVVDNGEQPQVDMSLDDFEKDFYPTTDKGEKSPTKEVVEETEEEEVEDSTESEEVDDLATEESEEVDEEEEEEKPQPKSKKNSAQERINKLTAEARQAQREVEALRREMETLKAGREKEEPKPLREQLPPEAPDPDAVDDAGEPIYPLGEFDKNYIRDLTKFTIEAESKAAKEKDAQEEWERGVKLAQEELAASWVEKVEAAEAEIPTLRDDITELTGTFEAIDPNYGEYLAMTIMQCDNGPEIMHYFSQNIGEAQRIVASGPAAATLAIGRLEAKLTKSSTNPDEQKQQRKVSTKAPTPPESGARGVNGRQNIRPDTENLDDFEKIFYPKR